jgi:hypothetical protein
MKLILHRINTHVIKPGMTNEVIQIYNCVELCKYIHGHVYVHMQYYCQYT